MAAKRLSDEIKFELIGNPDLKRQRLLIFFLPGNPGVVEYYRHFLSEVHTNVTKGHKIPELINGIATYGHSHSGFELSKTAEMDRPFNLQETIKDVKRRLEQTVKRYADNYGPVNVVLVGHSVGSYMVMEIADWWQREIANQPDLQRDFDIVGGVCLFPTVVDLKKSPKGRMLGGLLDIPYLHVAAGLLATVLSFIPLWLFNWAKMLTPGENPPPEFQAITEATIRSQNSARQAVYLAADEMREIREDKWHPSHVWGALDDLDETTEHATIDEGRMPPASLFFYWGQDDYWVDNGSRDKLIAKHYKWSTMMIDKHKMDHCFSLNKEHSSIVAKQVAEWIKELQYDSEDEDYDFSD